MSPQACSWTVNAYMHWAILAMTVAGTLAFLAIVIFGSMSFIRD